MELANGDCWEGTLPPAAVALEEYLGNSVWSTRVVKGDDSWKYWQVLSIPNVKKKKEKKKQEQKLKTVGRK